MLPANIRVNTGAPFPSLVKGSAPFVITKANGIWTIGLSLANVGIGTPSNTQAATDYVLIWDSISGNFFRVPLNTFFETNRLQRSVAVGPVTINDSDQILNLNLMTPQTIPLPGYLTRVGSPLIFKDVGNQATANPITIAGSGGDLIDGNASIPLNTNGQSITLLPANDGVNTGWFEI